MHKRVAAVTGRSGCQARRYGDLALARDHRLTSAWPSSPIHRDCNVLGGWNTVAVATDNHRVAAVAAGREGRACVGRPLLDMLSVD